MKTQALAQEFELLDRIQCGQRSGENYRDQIDEHDVPTKIYRHSADHLECFRF
jgi:hypothetical protein